MDVVVISSWTIGDLEESIKEELQRRQVNRPEALELRLACPVRPGSYEPASISLDRLDVDTKLRPYLKPDCSITATPVRSLSVYFNGRPLPFPVGRHWTVGHLRAAVRDEMRHRIGRELHNIVLHMQPGHLLLQSSDDASDLSNFGGMKDGRAVRIDATDGGPTTTTTTTKAPCTTTVKVNDATVQKTGTSATAEQTPANAPTGAGAVAANTPTVPYQGQGATGSVPATPTAGAAATQPAAANTVPAPVQTA